MSTVVYLLRAVNVGTATVPMPWLREAATTLGAGDVATYVNSGNLVCTPPDDPADFGRALERAIADDLGVTTDAIVRTGPQLAAAVATYPFPIHEDRFCHVWFLAGTPPDGTADAVADADFAPDRLALVGDDVHIRYENGVQGTKISAPRLLRLCQVPGTARNLRTVRRLAEMAIS